MFTCTFELDQRPIVLRVHDVDDEAAGMAHFQQLRTSHADAKTLAGIYSLGLPAYETKSGTVAFVRDAKTLEVDTTGLPANGLGATGDQSRTRIAYSMATSVLACWTAHN